jgi:hypothetical protein
VFRFIIEYSSLRDFWPLGSSRSIFIRGFLRDDSLACFASSDSVPGSSTYLPNQFFVFFAYPC